MSGLASRGLHLCEPERRLSRHRQLPQACSQKVGRHSEPAESDVQIIRRTIATLSQTKGHVKATQGLLRHSRTPTTADVYQQVIPEGVEKMVGSIHDEPRKPSAAPEKTSKIAADLRVRNRSRLMRKNAKLSPIDTKSLPSDSGSIG